MNEILKNTAIKYFIIAGLVTIFTIISFWKYLQWDGVLVELTGFLFDIVVFGLIITVYDYHKNRRKDLDKIKEQRDKIIREYYEQLEDYKEWGDKEGIYRKVGIIRRLINIGNKPYSLREINLNKAKLGGYDLSNMDFYMANFQEAHLINTKFINAELEYADFSKAKLFSTDFSNANLKYSTLNASYFSDSNFENADIQFAGLIKASDIKMEQLKTVKWNSSTKFPTHINVVELEKINPSVKE